jgi:hypothetical protein
MRAWVALSLLIACVPARGEETLCAAAEKVVFSCHVGKKIVSLCRPSDAPHGLTYRFGTPRRVELAHPARGRDAKGSFYTASGPLYGGGDTTVGFRRGEYEYVVYSRIGRSSGDRAQGGTPEFEDGLVVSRRGREIRRMVCDDGGEGFREAIDWLPQRN